VSVAVPPELAPYVTVTYAPTSAVRLRALEDQVRQAAQLEQVPWSIYVDDKQDQVILRVAKGSSIAPHSTLGGLLAQHSQQVSARYDLAPLTLAAAPAVDNCDFWTCPPPMRAGVETDEAASAVSGGLLCTTSFLAAPYSNPGLRYILSAGHCETTNSYRSPGPSDLFYAGPLIGNMSNYGNGDKNDSEGLNLNTAGAAYGSSNEATIYQRAYTSSSADLGPLHSTPAVEHFAVTGAATADQYVNGTFLCKSARTTGYTCGSIDQTNVSLQSCESGSNICYSYNSFFGANMCSNGGDSGGPIYSSNGAGNGGLAYGIVSSTNTYSSCDPSSETYSATIPNVMVGLGVQILTSTPRSGVV